MHKSFCTLFDSNYFHKGLALHESLMNTALDFTLWILCMDEMTFTILSEMNLENVRLIRFEEFASQDLLKLKKERTVAEFSWTCTANLCWYMLECTDADMITYLDADMCFYGDPQVIFDEISGAHIAIIEHRFSVNRIYLERLGKYNVSWVSFRNTPQGLRAAEWWKDRVNEWCFNRYENGKFGDQLYLDDWTRRFEGTHVIAHGGAGMAPWNIGDKRISIRDKKIHISNAPLVFYHFHGFHMLARGGYIASGNYYISPKVRRLIYVPYFAKLQEIARQIQKYNPSFSKGYMKLSPQDALKKMFFSIKIFEPIFLFFAKRRSM